MDSTRKTDEELKHTVNCSYFDAERGCTCGLVYRLEIQRLELDLQASRERQRELVAALKEIIGICTGAEAFVDPGMDDTYVADWIAGRCRTALARAEAKEKQ